MERRNFLKNSLLTTAAMTVGGTTLSATGQGESARKFKLKYAPHFGMFEQSAGKDLIDQLKFMHDQGFTAMEDNGMMGRTPEMQSKIGETMAKLGMTMGVFVVSFDNWPLSTSLTSGDKDWRDKFVKACREAVDVAKRVNAKWMTVVPGNYDRRLPMGIQTANVVESLRRGAEIFEPHNLTMVLEPLSDTPDLFMRYSDQTYLLCKAVNSPACKILFDMWHMQRNEGRMTVNMDLCWDEIAYFQIGDEPGRNEPTTGEVNYKNLFKHIHEKGFTGVLGMEHGNAAKGKEGEMAVIKAYEEVDAF
ncbi:MAG: TIM barrel protein [Saprospiraceae bacterium]|jgi:hydroxypyruvate isomerase|nr:TIM barrel protein [Saprospiraceae bacterium]